ncbi:MAG: ROK family protein [Bacteroidales bacterium]|nr:ROK family protein [Bacteroidales bacterium]MDD2426278.1 ROK family protein [Bacteroidales bacterium]MDD3989890.1 ROK family protein [Bacteroidales bacterium]MDD4638289.1 ROK family protein [Bacteroidales bacterium]
MYEHDKRIVLTLDAGATNFLFSAIAGAREVIEPVAYPAYPADLEKCLLTIEEGFSRLIRSLDSMPVAISFAFPGPADYQRGLIGDLPNFPAFRGGVALGPFLQERFGIPVFINNDGDLFAYGEALAGALVQTNRLLAQKGSDKFFNNLLGVTFGSGFGAGVVINNVLLVGDNSCGGDVWCFRNKTYPDMICEESVSIRGIRRHYCELSGEESPELTPKDIFNIAEGIRKGNREAAIRSFEMLGEVAGNTIAQALTIVDGLVVIGGGIVGASKYFLPALIKEMNSTLGSFKGEVFPRMQMKAYNLEDESDLQDFLTDRSISLNIPLFSDGKIVYDTGKQMKYNPIRQTGVTLSKLGTNKAVALGAYAYAISQLGQI